MAYPIVFNDETGPTFMALPEPVRDVLAGALNEACTDPRTLPQLTEHLPELRLLEWDDQGSIAVLEIKENPEFPHVELRRIKWTGHG